MPDFCSKREHGSTHLHTLKVCYSYISFSLPRTSSVPIFNSLSKFLPCLTLLNFLTLSIYQYLNSSLIPLWSPWYFIFKRIGYAGRIYQSIGLSKWPHPHTVWNLCLLMLYHNEIIFKQCFPAITLIIFHSSRDC